MIGLLRGKCPHCGNRNIRKRYSEHRRYKWRCRNCNQVFRKPAGSFAVWLGLAVVVVVALIFVVQQGIVALPAASSPLSESVDRTAVMPTATSQTASTQTPERAAAQAVVPAARATHTVTPTATLLAQTLAPKIADIPTLTATPTPMAIPTLIPTSTATLVPTSTPTATPVPVKLLLDAEAVVAGYWSDGTANIDLAVSLRNEGSLPFQDNQPITVSCTHQGSVVEDCGADTQISLPDGFSAATANLILRAPMGLVTLDIHYGTDEVSTVQVNVPERILGVERDIWECYSDRDTARNYQRFHGCYGWYSETVEKWRSGSTVHVWATGNASYIRAFREILNEELAPLLNLDFRWVDEELDADFITELGVSVSERYNDWQRCGECWGYAGPVGYGEVRGGSLIIFHQESHDDLLDQYEKLKRLLRGVVIHESLHALAPTGHAEPANALSIMASSEYLTYMDKAILRLNSHPLVKPGMTMDEVRQLIVLRDELLDDPKTEPDPYEMTERTFAVLRNAKTARMKVRGGWIGGNCTDERFGYPEWATLEISHFLRWPDDPLIAHLRDGRKSFFIFYSDEAADIEDNGWQHWGKSENKWKRISRRQLSNDTAWWIRNSKLHWTLAIALQNQSADDIELVEKSDGKMTIKIEFNPTEFAIYSSTTADEINEMVLTIDETTHKVERFTWIHRYGDRDHCHTYTEEATDIEYGVEIDIPDAVVKGSKYALP